MTLSKKVIKKHIALFLSMLMLFVTVMPSVPVFAAVPVTVAAWDYTAVPSSGSAPATSGANQSGAALTNSQGKTPTYSSGSLSTTPWSIGSYWEISLSTKGYNELTIAAKTRSSNTGPRNFKLQYSTDGTTFYDISGSTYSIASTTLSNFMPTVTLPADAADCDNVKVRFTVADNVSVNNGAIASGGTSNINNIVVSGVAASTSKVSNVTASPNGGAVAINTEVTLATATADATIMYCVDGSVYSQYSGPITLTSLPAKIGVYAEKTGLTTSDVSIFEYTQATNGGTVMPVTATPSGGAVALGSTVSLSTATAGATIKYKYSVNESVYNDYNGAITLDTLPKTIIAYALKDGSESTASTFNYTQNTGGSVAEWQYTAAPTTNTVSATGGVNKEAATLTNSQNSTPSYSTGSLSTSGWDVGKYWQLNLSTSGYKDLILNAKTRSTGTGPKNFKVQYSTDGTNFVDVPSGTYSIATTTLSDIPAITLPAQAADCDNLIIRFTVADSISQNGGTIAATGGSNINNIIISGTVDPLTANRVASVKATPVSGAAAIGDKVTLTTATDAAKIKYSVDNGVTYSDYNQTIALTSLPAKIMAYAEKTGMTTSKTSTFDYTQAKVEAVTATPGSGKIVVGSSVTLSSKTQGAAIKYSLDNGVTYLDYTASIVINTLPQAFKAYAVKAGYTNSDVVEFKYEEKLVGEYNTYFGQLHSHTNISDGQGSITDAFDYAKNTAEHIDFLAVTDHSNSFDDETTATMAGSSGAEWKLGHDTADAVTDGSFVGIYGFEMTWSNGLGHINTFNTPGFESRNTAKFKQTDALQQYYDILKQYPESISQFNHPGTTFGDFNDFANYDPQIDARISLVEVGNGEGAIRGSGYFPSYEYYTRALDKGWHVAPTNNQDNHKSKWGDANTARSVVLADSLTRDSIYDAMRNMRVYATEDNDLSIKYTLNDEIMGSSLSAKPEKVNIKVDLADPDNEALGTVSVIVNGGKVAASKTLTSSAEQVSFELSPDYSYYYIRVDQADKDIAVTAPVWIGAVEKLGITKTSSSSKLPVKGEELTIKTDLYNNESTDFTINSLTYSIDGNNIHTASGLTSVASLGTQSYSFPYTFTGAGKYTVNVQLTGTLNGVEKVFNDVLKVEVADPAMITKVVADGTHFNDYVYGYYANNLNNFTTLANAQGVTVNVEKNKLTDEALADAKLLIVSAPAKKTGTANGVSYTPSEFSAEDLAVIKKYVDNGGNLIVCGIADYQDGTGVYQSSTQLNKLLETIGATSRINDDEVVDNTTNGGQTYRLAFDDYNMTSPYLNGVGASQTYSLYSGCSIGLDEASIASGKTQWLVKGHATTESIDSDKKGDGTPQPQGSVYALAVEKLSGGGNMFIGGSVFVSDFEVKATMDNYQQLQNSNYNITMNIMDSIKKEISATPIATIRKAAKGESFVAEGIVTAGTVSGNAFFDTIYIQDSTGGIDIFPVSGMDIKVGQKVRVVGSVDEYEGDLELRVTQVSVTDPSINPVAPTVLTTQAAMNSTNAGLLTKVTGTVTSVKIADGVISEIKLKDNSGEEARVFINGYIGYSNTQSAKLESFVKEGANISAIGLASVDPEGARLRVRDKSEIVIANASIPTPTDDSPQDNSSDSPVTTPTPTPTPTEPKISSEGTTAKITLTAPADDKGKLSANLTAAEISDLLEKAKQVGNGRVNVGVEASGTNPVQTVETILSLEAIEQLNDGKVTTLQITTPIATVSFDQIALKVIEEATTGKVVVSVKKPDEGSEKVQAFGDRPAYEIDVRSSDKTLSDFKDGKVTVTLPYTPKAGENPNNIVINAVDANGNVSAVGFCNYNESTQTIALVTNHLSQFTVAYNENKFADIKGHWAEESINFVTARNLFAGTAEDRFSPDAPVTRGMAVTVLGRAAHADVSGINSSRFSDVRVSDWYAAYVEWAAQNHIVSGTGNGRFDPDQLISREELASLVTNFAEYADLNLTQINANPAAFADSSSIASWAKEGVTQMQKTGIISGKDGGIFDPNGMTTRAEFSVILKNVTRNVVK